MEKSSLALTIMPRMPRPWMKTMLLTMAAANRRTARSLPGAVSGAPEHDDGQPAHRRGGQQEPDDVAGGGAGEDAQPAAPAAEDRQAGEAQQQVEADGGEGPPRAESQPREHDGQGLQRDGYAETADGNGGDQGGTGHQGGKDGDQAKVGGVPAAPAARGQGCGGVVGLRHGVPVECCGAKRKCDSDCTVAGPRVFCRRPTKRRPGCWRAPPMSAARRPHWRRAGPCHGAGAVPVDL